MEDWEHDHEKLAQITESSRAPKKNENENLDDFMLFDKVSKAFHNLLVCFLYF